MLFGKNQIFKTIISKIYFTDRITLYFSEFVDNYFLHIKFILVFKLAYYHLRMIYLSAVIFQDKR